MASANCLSCLAIFALSLRTSSFSFKCVAPNSVAYALGNAEADTLFDKMKGEQRRVSKVATDLAALNETMRGYLAQAQNPALKGV